MSEYPRVVWSNGKERVVLIDNVTFQCERASSTPMDAMNESFDYWLMVHDVDNHCIVAHAFDAMTQEAQS